MIAPNTTNANRNTQYQPSPLRAIAGRDAAQWREPSRKPSTRRKRLISLHAGLVNALCAVVGFSTASRELISLLLDVSEGEKKVEKSDTALIHYLATREAGLTKAAARKRLQRGRSALIFDQKKSGDTLIACCPGDKIKNRDGTEDYKDSTYDLDNLWGVLTAALAVAQPKLKTATDRAAVLQAAVKEVLPDFPFMAPLRLHKPKRQPSRDELDDRARAQLQRLARHVYEASEGTDDQRRAEVLRLVTEALEAGEQSSELVHQMHERKVDKAGEMPLPVPAPFACGEGTAGASAAVCSSVEVDKMSTVSAASLSQSTPRIIKTAENEALGPDEFKALTAFESVGARPSLYVMLDDAKPDNEKRQESDNLSLEKFRADLPALLGRARNNRWSFAVRMTGRPENGNASPVIQIDDCDAATVERLRPLSFITIETSRQNYQVWLAIPAREGESQQQLYDRLKSIRDRVLRALGKTANGGAYGSVRWPGSINFKLSRKDASGLFPMVTVEYVSLGRTVTEEELKAAGLLLPEPEKKVQQRQSVQPRQGEPRKWPSWEIERDRAPRKENGEIDTSAVDFVWCMQALRWRWSVEEVKARLPIVSPTAGKKTAHYINITVENAASKVWRAA